MKKNLNWEKVSSEKGPELKLVKGRWDHVKNPRTGEIRKMIVLESLDAANVVALTPDREMVFVRQYRFGTGTITLEIPGGLIEEGEKPDIAVMRELEEETGYRSPNSPAYLGKIASNPVFIEGWIYHYVVEGVQHETVQKLDAGEAIEVVTIPEAEVREMLAAGKFMHPHTTSALNLYFHGVR